MRYSRSNLGFVRILACRLDIILCLRHWGTRLVVVLWVRFMKSRSCRLCNDWTRVFGSAVTRSLKLANLRTRNRARAHSPLKSTWSWVPSDTYACAEIAHYSHLQHANELGECHLEQRKHLRDENFMGDHGHFYVTHTSWGSQVAFLRLKKLRWVILGPRRIF